MLNVTMEKALESVALPQSVTDALLHGTGVFAPFLALTKACESGDDAMFAKMADEPPVQPPGELGPLASPDLGRKPEHGLSGRRHTNDPIKKGSHGGALLHLHAQCTQCTQRTQCIGPAQSPWMRAARMMRALFS